MYGQGLRNDGAHIVVSNNANIYIDGTTGHYTANNTAYITRSGAGNGGTIRLNGNWVNNSSTVAFSNNMRRVELVGGSPFFKC